VVALSLLKHVYAKIDYEAKEHREVDFALVNAMEIKQLIEAKYSDKTLVSSLHYFHQKYDLPAVQVVKDLRQERKEGDILIRKADAFLEELLL
jgi:hypothetical protein